ncbi:DNA polymerase I [Candidatus Dependentiae bacterium]|nr:DNA polymerase I [Candidatus Dependentiae bacterium]
MQKKNSTLVLIDASSLLYRAFYGLKPLSTSKGQPVQAVYGFFKSLRQILDQYSPFAIAVVWDKGDSGRKEMYPDYKKNRQAAPSDLLEQRHTIQLMCDAIQIPQVSVVGFEADDVIFTFANRFKDEVEKIVVVSPDKDLRQLVSERCVVADPINRKTYTPEEFFKKYEFNPDLLSTYFALLGDSSDDIPGVAGIGDTRATALVKQFNSLEDLYENIEQVASPAVKKSLLAGRENAFISRELFTLKTVSNATQTLDGLKYDSSLWSKANDYFYELEFKSFLPAGFKPVTAQHEVLRNWHVGILKTMQDVALVFERLSHAAVITFDTETIGIGNMTSEIVGFSLAGDALEGYYISLVHDLWTSGEIEQIKKNLSNLLEHHTCVVMHNAKFDLHVLANWGIQIEREVDDTMLMAELLTTSEDQKVGLKALSLRLLGESMQEYKDVVGIFPDFGMVPLEEAAPYATHDVVQTYKLYQLLFRQLSGHAQLLKLYEQTERPLATLLFKMERAGILLDARVLQGVATAVKSAISVVDGKIQSYLVSIEYPDALSFNPLSPKQVGQVLYEYLRLTPPQKTATGKLSTSREVLDLLSKIHPFPALIVEQRELSKLLNTYLEPLPQMVSLKDGRIHTSYSQVAVATGRLASSDPNLQNIPIASEFGAEIRSAFVAQPGHVLIGCDYAQVELRVLAHLTKDPVLLAAFKNNEDPHRQIAARLFSKPENEVTQAERQIGKKINFSIIYGLTPYGLSQDLNISFKDAKRYVEQYFEHYPAVLPWMQGVEEFAREIGYVETLFGRRRYVPGLRESNKVVYEAARRVAINTVVQGTAADIIKKAMLEVDRTISSKFPGARLLLQIHDELVLEVPAELQELVSGVVVEIMQKAVLLDVDLKVSVGVGSCWKDL